MKKPVIRAADLFCGAGGASASLSRACLKRGVSLDLVAVNHWQPAIATHSANHPHVRHYQEFVDDVNPAKAVPGGKLDLLLAGPECTHHSTARGGKPVNDQSRASAWCVLRWATALQIDTILIENVREFTGWGPLGSNGRPLKSRKGQTFAAYLDAFRALGYRVDWRILNAANYGDPTTRERLFIQCRRGRRPIAWPEPTHSQAGEADLFGRREKWKPARDVIDWSRKGESIFTRKRPLKPNTLRRIAEGLKRFGGEAAEPFLVMLYGTGTVQSVERPLPTVTASGEHIGLAEPFVLHTTHDGERRTHGVDDPLPTITGANRGELALCEPFMLGQQSGATARPVSEPMPTVAAAGAISLIQPFIVPTNYGERQGQRPRSHGIDDPLPTVVGTTSHAVVEPIVLQMSQTGSNGHRCRSVDSPLPTVTTADDLALVTPFLVQYHGNGRSYPVDEPIRTVDGNDRYGLVSPEGTQRLDILFRMLYPEELARGMSFPADYKFIGNRGQIVKQIGNAWPGELGEALCAALLESA